MNSTQIHPVQPDPLVAVYAALDDVMDGMPRPQALRFEADLLDRVNRAEQTSTSADVFGLVEVCRPFPALLDALHEWRSQFLFDKAL